MKIIRLDAENFKRLRAVSITPDGSVVQITGENGSGKSSVLDAIFAAIVGKKGTPSKPIRNGERSARVTLDLGEVIITRRFTESGDAPVIVEAASGARFQRPQQILDSLFGALSFDPLAFSRADRKSQLETLRALAPLDVDVDALDGLNRRDFELRAEWNRRAKSFTERVSSVRQQVDDTVDVALVDTSELLTKMQEASERNAAIDRHQRGLARMEEDRANALSSANAARREAQRLLQDAERFEARATEIGATIANAPAAPEPVNVVELRAQIDEAQSRNAAAHHQIRQRDELARATRELDEAMREADALTAAMEDRTRQKVEAIGRAQMPVDGLAFGDGEVLYNGLPFDQASTAEQIRVSMAIAMAMNPKLKVVLIKDGSLLDAKSLAIVEQMAEAHDYQVFVESVRTDSPIGIVLEAGEVVAVNGQRVMQEEVVSV